MVRIANTGVVGPKRPSKSKGSLARTQRLAQAAIKIRDSKSSPAVKTRKRAALKRAGEAGRGKSPRTNLAGKLKTALGRPKADAGKFQAVAKKSVSGGRTGAKLKAAGRGGRSRASSTGVRRSAKGQATAAANRAKRRGGGGRETAIRAGPASVGSRTKAKLGARKAAIKGRRPTSRRLTSVASRLTRSRRGS